MHDDWLMRQINQFAIGLAEAIAGETLEVEQADLEFEHVFGASPSLLIGMSGDSLMTMVKGGEAGVDPGRAVTMAVGLATHAHELPEHKRSDARAKSLRLLDAALEAAPSLKSPEFDALRETQTLDPTAH